MSSLESRLEDLITRIGTEFKSVRSTEGTLSTLSTTAKTSLVAAINELKAAVDAAATSGGASIDDAHVATSTTYSSNKIVAAILALISDGTTDTTHTWSSTQIAAAIGTAVANLVNSSPGTLDTLKELADALGDDPNFATTLSTALGYRLRVDAAQTFTAPQLAQGQANLNVYDKSAFGNPDTDLVAVFVAALS